MSGWRFWACLAILAFVFRAMVPAGFMPDAGAMRDGRLEVTFCMADGMSMAQPIAPGAGESDGGHAASVPACPYGILAAQAFVAPSGFAPPSVRLAAVYVLPHIAPHPLSHFFASGFPLGPRAPPLSRSNNA